MDIVRALKLGVRSLIILVFLDLIGLPLTVGAPVVYLFAFLVLIMSLLFLRPSEDAKPAAPRQKAIEGLVLGLVAGIGLAAITFLFASLQADGIRVNKVFSQLLPEHTGALTGLEKQEVLQGANTLPGLSILVVSFAVSGLIGGLLSQVDYRRSIRQITQDGRSKFSIWFTTGLPLLFFAAFLILKIEGVDIWGPKENIFGLMIVYLFITSALFTNRSIESGRRKVSFNILLVIALIVLPLISDQFQNAVLGKIAIFIIMGIGLNIVVGYAGLLDLGYVAFFAIGSYTYGLISAPNAWFISNIQGFSGVNFWVGIGVAVILGVLAGVLLGIPVLRMRGDYLAIVTLGFGEIIRLLMLNLRDYTGGPGGVLDIPPPVLFGYDLGSPRNILYIAMFFGVIVTIIAIRLRSSRLGRAWIALREDEDVAQAMGINLVAIKLTAFAIGAAFASLGGVVYAVWQDNIFPDNFQLDVSINVLSLIIIGGIASLDGVILGSIALIGLPEILRTVEQYRIITFGALLVAMMILRPEGLLPSTRRKQELQSGEDSTSHATGEV